MTSAPRLICIALLIVAAGSVDAAAQTVIARRYTPADRVTGRYQYVPFDVPAGTTQLRVEQTYDKAGGTNAIDLGLVEPGALALASRALRGWSGGARNEIVLSPGSASPGYRVGPIPAGRWHVILGLYKIAPSGVDVTLKLTFGSEPNPSRRWYAGDLHLHTVHSDGSTEPARVLEMAREAGLDFVAITDHNNTTHAVDVPPDPNRKPLHIVGEEITTPGGHANVWGLKPGDWIDFRITADDQRINELAAAASARGAMFSINHPVAECDACDWKQPIPPQTASIEVWNGGLGPQPEAIAIWDRLLRSGRRVTGVASSDWHRAPAVIGAGSVRVFAESLTEQAVLQAVAAGAVVMMRDPTSAPPLFTVSSGTSSATVGETIRAKSSATLDVLVHVPPFTSPGLAACPMNCSVELSWNGEKVNTAAATGGSVSFTRKASDGYLRVAVLSGATIVALTNPIFVSTR